VIDRGDPKWPHVEERLKSETIMWLTTVRRDGQPQSSPVWFLWDGEAFLMFSMPSASKVANVRANPRVSVHLSDDGQGEDVVTFEATAEVTADPVQEHDPAYVEKYRQLIADLGYEIEPFARAYSTGIRIVPTRARVW
jgi:PPOX class probable F420-dependent enzyme